mgnify:FL=1
MEDLANTDGLTGLYNERYFDALLKENELNRTPFVLFYLDLDRFKPVNDRYGHDVGDQLLKEVASRLRGCVRGGAMAWLFRDAAGMSSPHRQRNRSGGVLQEPGGKDQGSHPGALPPEGCRGAGWHQLRLCGLPLRQRRCACHPHPGRPPDV